MQSTMKYKNPVFRKLKDEQVRKAPLADRLALLDRAEHVVAELDPDRTYPVADLYERITGQRPETVRPATVSGRDALHDLRLFVEDVSDSANISADRLGEPVLTVRDVSRRFNVSTKTVDRWRDRGLVSRRFLFGKRKGVGFTQSAVERFARDHADEVRRGSRFSLLDEGERAEIIARAKDLAQQGATTAEITRQLASQFGRSPETIRLTLKRHDREHPEEAILHEAKRGLSDERKAEIARRAMQGASLERLAREFGCSVAAVRRAVKEERIRRLWSEPVDYVYNPEFDAPNADEVILGPEPPESPRKSSAKPPAGLPPYLASLYEVPLLTREQERYYFRKMNYLKYKAAKLRERLDPKKVSTRDLDRLEELLRQATEVRNLLIRRNLRLVVSICKKYATPGTNFFEMVSDGNVSLMRAIDRFDYSRGFKLSTYATWAIRKNFARSIPAEYARRDRFRTGLDELFQSSRDDRGSAFEQELIHEGQRRAIDRVLHRLSERERQIIVNRFGLNRGTEPQTLEQVGMKMGVTKERIRQLERRALDKLRRYVAEEKLEVPGV